MKEKKEENFASVHSYKVEKHKSLYNFLYMYIEYLVICVMFPQDKENKTVQYFLIAAFIFFFEEHK